MEDGFSGISVVEIGNGFVKISQTDIKVTLFGFYYYLSNKYIMFGATETSIYLQNGTIIDNMIVKIAFYRGYNYLLSK